MPIETIFSIVTEKAVDFVWAKYKDNKSPQDSYAFLDKPKKYLSLENFWKQCVKDFEHFDLPSEFDAAFFESQIMQDELMAYLQDGTSDSELYVDTLYPRISAIELDELEFKKAMNQFLKEFRLYIQSTDSSLARYLNAKNLKDAQDALQQLGVTIERIEITTQSIDSTTKRTEQKIDHVLDKMEEVLGKVKPQKKIFLSYGRGDDHPDYDDYNKSFMRKLYNDLTDADLKVWWDRKDLPSRGLSFLTEIQEAIDKCEILVLVVGEHAMKSDYVRSEWKYALDRCIPIIPILRNGDYNLLPPELSRANTIDFRDDSKYSNRLNNLIDRLSQSPAQAGQHYGVPQLPPSFIDRQVIQDVRESILIDSTRPMVITSQEQTNTVYGIGGIGKTVLATAIAHNCDVKWAFPDGIFFLEFGETINVVTRMIDIGVALGDDRDEYKDLQSARTRLSIMLNNKRTLIILDDVWNASDVEAFNILSTGNRILVTSRIRAIATVLDAQETEVPALTVTEGLALIAKRLNMTPETLPAECTEMIELLEGHTLAITLIASKLHQRKIGYADALLKRLKERQGFKDLGFPEVGNYKNFNLEVSLAISYEDLTSNLRRNFRELGILTPNASFSENLLQSIWGFENSAQTDDTVNALIDTGLITPLTSDRFSEHGLLRIYGHALLEQTKEKESTFYRYVDAIIQLAGELKDSRLEKWSDFEVDFPHINHIGDSLVEQYYATNSHYDSFLKQCSDFSWNTIRYFERRPAQIFITKNNNRTPQRINWYKMGASVFEKLDSPHYQAPILTNLGLRCHLLGKKNDAIDYYEQALKITQKISDQAGEATVLNNLGGVYDSLGRKEEAISYYEQAYSLYMIIKNDHGKATTLNNIGMLYDSLGRKEEAISYYEQAYSLYLMHNDKYGASISLSNIADSNRMLGDITEALEKTQKVLLINQQLGNISGESTAYNNLGEIYKEIGDTSKAMSFFDKSLSLARQVGDRDGEATTLNNIGNLCNILGFQNAACEFLEEALHISKETSNTEIELTTTNNLALVYSELGNNHKALEYAEKALIQVRQLNHINEEATILSNIGLFHNSIGNKTAAIAYYNQALKVDQQMGNKQGEASSLRELGKIYTDIEDFDNAISHFFKSLPILKLLGNLPVEAETYNILAILFYAIGEIGRAIECQKNCINIQEEINHPDVQKTRADLLWLEEKQ